MHSYQIKVKPVPISTLILRPAFQRGYVDKLLDVPFDYHYLDFLPRGQRWSYERGRQFAFFFKGDLKSQEAVRAYYALTRSGDITP